MPGKKKKETQNRGYYQDSVDSLTDKDYTKGYFKDHQESGYTASNEAGSDNRVISKTGPSPASFGGYYNDMERDILTADDDSDNADKHACGKSCNKESGRCCDRHDVQTEAELITAVPENVLYFDMSFGVSGDMFCAALLDLKIMSIAELTLELSKLNISSEYVLSVRECKNLAYHALSFTVEVKEGVCARRFSDILEIVAKSVLADDVKRIAVSIFYKLAEAEAGIHECELKDVTFHECGAVDSIIDIVAAAILLRRLNPSAIYTNSFNVGGGTVECGSEKFPVPAPATAALLRGYDISFGGDFEKTTPTGAAIMTTVLTAQRGITDTNLLAYGRGAGTRGGGALTVYLLKENLWIKK